MNEKNKTKRKTQILCYINMYLRVKRSLSLPIGKHMYWQLPKKNVVQQQVELDREREREAKSLYASEYAKLNNSRTLLNQY